jgi:hypothetical protein
MGYKRQRKQFRLKFETGGEYDGFECLAKSLNLEALLDLQEKAAAAGVTPDGEQKVNPEAIREMAGLLIENIVTWNLEDEDGTPIPIALSRCVASGKDTAANGHCPAHAEEPYRCNATGLMTEDASFAMDLMMAWMGGMAGVSDPLSRNSSDGKQSLEVSIPMETSSLNHGNSAVPIPS